jgi:hypothetical protein
VRSIIVKLRQATDLSGEMTRMRSWLDDRGFTPSQFQYHLEGHTVIVRVVFEKDREAEAFRKEYNGLESAFINGGRPSSRETMEQVCWWRLTAEEIRTEADGYRSKDARETMAQVAQSYDRMAEDLETRLVNPRYRSGLLVG